MKIYVAPYKQTVVVNGGDEIVTDKIKIPHEILNYSLWFNTSADGTIMIEARDVDENGNEHWYVFDSIPMTNDPNNMVLRAYAMRIPWIRIRVQAATSGVINFGINITHQE